MDKNSIIFVAGHNGLVGSAIVRRIRDLGYQKIILKTRGDLDLKNQAAVNNFFSSEKPEYVFLAAARVGGILANNTYRADFIYDNLIISANVIHASYLYGVKKLLNLGSSCIYPKFAPQPMREEFLLTGSLEPTNEPYAIAKISAVKLCRYYNEQYRTNFISVMPTNLYGPNDHFDFETSHVLPALIRKFHLAKLLVHHDWIGIMQDIERCSTHISIEQQADLKDDKSIRRFLSTVGITEKTVTLWGSGEPFREFLYIDDFVDACFFLMERFNYNDIGEIVNIGCGEDIKIKELAHYVSAIVGFKGEIKFDHSKPDGTPRKLLDVSKINGLGWYPKVGLEEGIRLTYAWYTNKLRF